MFWDQEASGAQIQPGTADRERRRFCLGCGRELEGDSGCPSCPPGTMIWFKRNVRGVTADWLTATNGWDAEVDEVLYATAFPVDPISLVTDSTATLDRAAHANGAAKPDTVRLAGGSAPRTPGLFSRFLAALRGQRAAAAAITHEHRRRRAEASERATARLACEALDALPYDKAAALAVAQLGARDDADPAILHDTANRLSRRADRIEAGQN